MAKVVITNAKLLLGGVDYSAQTSRVSLTMESDTPEVTNMDSLAWREYLQGLKSWQLGVEFKKDADLSGLDSAMWTAFNGGAVVAMRLQKNDATISTTEPEWQGDLLVNNWTPIDNSVGEAYGASYTWRGTGALTRDVTP